MPGAASCLRRVILIGASNVTLGFPLVFNSCLESLPAETELFAIHGHGRSFCQWSYVLNRGLPPVLECGLWQALKQRPAAAQTWGLVTDTGNDLIYGRSVDDLITNVTTAFQRLHELGAVITYVGLPVERIMMLSDLSYRIAKKMLFPGPTVPWKTMSARVLEFDERVRQVASQYATTILIPRLPWYGIDPIHIRKSQSLIAWREILEAWSFPEQPKVVAPSYNAAMNLWHIGPAERTYSRQPFYTRQPCLSLNEETFTLWQY